MVNEKLIKVSSSTFNASVQKDDGEEPIENLFISGYASTTSPDRVRDVILESAWMAGLESYLKNPIVLGFHDHTNPIGRVVEHKVSKEGLWVKARISSAAEDIYKLIQDGIVTAFSVGFLVKDADYDANTDIFVIKELELREISVVSVPCNQDTLFSLSKSFDTEQEYSDFKKQFASQAKTAKETAPAEEVSGITHKEIGMDPKEFQEATEAAVQKAVARALEVQEEKRKAAEAEAARKAKEEQDLQERINKAVAAITPTKTGAEDLLKEIEKRVEAQLETGKNTLDELNSAIAEKTKELAAIQNRRVDFADKGDPAGIAYKDKETAVMLSKIMKKDIADTRFGKALLEKALGAGASQSGAGHLPSQTWEHEVSTNMEAEVRRRLVMAPLLRSINMKTNVMSFPVNPEAGLATWVLNTSYGTTASPGSAQTHSLAEVTLNAYKVATLEYLNFEEEEDSLIILLPIVRDAMVRRLARAVDRAYLRGAGSGTDPVKGISVYDATSAVVVTNTSTATVATMRSLRKDIGAWGLDPAEVYYVVSTDVYYDLLDDTIFQTVDKVGDRATLLTGQVGAIGNSPVLVSAEFPTKAGGTNTAATNIAAMCFAPANFMVGNQRGLRFDTDDLVETQRKVLVSSLRTGLVQVTTNLGMGVSTLRWS